jgi:hypothetical protein
MVCLHKKVFGIPYGGIEQCSLLQLFQCKTLDDCMKLVKSFCFGTIDKLIYKLDEGGTAHTTVPDNCSEEGDDWSYSTIESAENVSAKSPNKKKNRFHDWASPRIQHKRVLTSCEEYNFVYLSLLP